MSELIHLTRQLGLGHIQLGLAPLLFLDDKRKHFELSQLRTSGLTVTAGMISFPDEDYSTINRIRLTGGYLPDDTWPLRRQLTTQSAKLARELGLSIITTHVGFIPQSNHPDYPTLIERVGEIASDLAASDIKLGMETGQEPAPELLQFLNDLPSRNIGVNFDPANMILYGSGDPIAAVKTLDRHICHVHIKDAIASNIPGIEWGKLAPVGSGQVNFEQLLIALADVGYAGPLAIEQESIRRGIENVEAAIRFLQNLPC
jgi:sugar phosphate isomerase/epimerase